MGTGVLTVAPHRGPRTPTLDCAEIQILVGFAGGARPFHHRILYHRVGVGRWIVATPTGDVFVEDFGRAEVLPLTRAGFLPDGPWRIYAFHPMSDASYQRLKVLSDVVLAVLRHGREAAAAIADPHWFSAPANTIDSETAAALAENTHISSILRNEGPSPTRPRLALEVPARREFQESERHQWQMEAEARLARVRGAGGSVPAEDAPAGSAGTSEGPRRRRRAMGPRLGRGESARHAEADAAMPAEEVPSGSSSGALPVQPRVRRAQPRGATVRRRAARAALAELAGRGGASASRGDVPGDGPGEEESARRSGEDAHRHDMSEDEGGRGSKPDVSV